MKTISKKLLITVFAFGLISFSLASATENTQPKKIYYNPYYMLLGRSALNLAGAALSCVALQKCIPDTYRTAKELGQISTILYFIGQQSKAHQKFEPEKRTWVSIQRLNEAIRKWNQFDLDFSKKHPVV